ncbi:MAG: hypothetical protein LUE93_13335 [Bacteroides sp.]|nr:hypothetical protein [Bacteroides sp.]
MTWKEITIKQFKQLQAILKEHEGDNVELSVKLLSLFTGKEESYYLNLSVDDFKEATRALQFLHERPQELIKEKYKVNGQVYTLNVNVSKMPTAQYIDYVTTLQNQPDNYALLLAILLIPQGKEYNSGYDIPETALLFEEHFRWADVQAIAFFSRLLQQYTKHMLNYLKRKLAREMKKEKNPERIAAIQTAINHLKAAGNGI